MRDHEHILKQGKFQLYIRKKNHYEDTQALDQEDQEGPESFVLGGFQDLTDEATLHEFSFDSV